VVDESTFNILKHGLVPKHAILGDNEVKALERKLNITRNQLPKIFTTDAAVKAIEGKIGDVVKIERPSPTAGDTLYYRIIVKKTRKK